MTRFWFRIRFVKVDDTMKEQVRSVNENTLAKEGFKFNSAVAINPENDESPGGLSLEEGSVMVASYLPSSYLISASILSNLDAHLISYLIYGCGLVSS